MSPTPTRGLTPRRVAVALGVSLSLSLVACGTADEAGTGQAENAGSESGSSAVATSRPDGTLAGTTWRLVEFQSMDDATGSLRPADSSDYTLTLNADGSAALRLDCNRATGTWTAEPSPDEVSGTFRFGPMATTLAMCPPPSIGEQIGARLQWVRGYLIRDGRLNLSLMADGGILVWEPGDREEPFETESDPALEAAILEAAPDYTAEMVEIGRGGLARYVYGREDLNEDGTPETLVYLLGPFFCGSGGCDLLLFTRATDGYSLVQSFPISRLPVIVSPERSNGWHDLVRLESGGGAPSTYLRHRFDGEGYVEGERMEAATTSPEGSRLLAGELTFEAGIPLEPRR